MQIKAYYIQRTTVRPELKQWKLHDNVIKFLKCFKQANNNNTHLPRIPYLFKVYFRNTYTNQRKHDQQNHTKKKNLLKT